MSSYCDMVKVVELALFADTFNLISEQQNFSLNLKMTAFIAFNIIASP